MGKGIKTKKPKNVSRYQKSFSTENSAPESYGETLAEHLNSIEKLCRGGSTLQTPTITEIESQIRLGQKPPNASPFSGQLCSRWSYPLPIAIQLGNPLVVEYLLQRGSYVDVWGYNFASPLYIAVAHAPRRLHDLSPQRAVGAIQAPPVLTEEYQNGLTRCGGSELSYTNGRYEVCQ